MASLIKSYLQPPFSHIKIFRANATPMSRFSGSPGARPRPEAGFFALRVHYLGAKKGNTTIKTRTVPYSMGGIHVLVGLTSWK